MREAPATTGRPPPFEPGAVARDPLERREDRPGVALPRERGGVGEALVPPPGIELAADRFAPPDSGPRSLPELAEVPTRVVAVGERSRPVSSAPPLAHVGEGESLIRPPLMVRARELLDGSARARFVAGLTVAFLIGLLPAQVYTWSRASSGYDDIRDDLVAEYRTADTQERWETLAAAREDAIALVDSRRARDVVSACFIWIAVAGAAGFAWSRLVREPSPREG
jgi:hypothetical protein